MNFIISEPYEEKREKYCRFLLKERDAEVQKGG